MRVLVVFKHLGAFYFIKDYLRKAKFFFFSTYINKSKLKFKKKVFFFKKNPTENEIKSIIIKKKISLIISGTSESYDAPFFNIEQSFIKVGKQLSIKTISFLDFFSNLQLRFSTNFKKKYDALPDIIVANKLFKKNFNILKKKTKIFYLHNFNNSFVKFKKNNFNKKNILFISQPISERNQNIVSFNEKILLNKIIKLLENRKSLYNLSIKLHPNEKPKKYDFMLKKFNRTNIEILPYKKKIKYSKFNLFIGMYSHLLYSLSLNYTNVISVQFGKKKVHLPNVKMISDVKSIILFLNRSNRNKKIDKKKLLIDFKKDLNFFKNEII
jgi:hypothetical protein